jgi:hypothetical protein
VKRLAILVALIAALVIPAQAGASTVECLDPFLTASVTVEDDSSGRNVDFSWEHDPGCTMDVMVRLYAWRSNNASRRMIVVDWVRWTGSMPADFLRVTDPIGDRPLLVEARTGTGTRILAASYIQASGGVRP